MNPALPPGLAPRRAAPAPELPPQGRSGMDVRPGCAAAPEVASEQLFRGRSVVPIQHNGATYLLRATKLGKLILTK